MNKITQVRNWKKTPWVWDVHFKPQSEWIRHCNVTLICYSLNLVQEFIKVTKCNSNGNIKNVNPTLKNDEVKTIWSTLTSQVRSFLLEKYRNDFKIYSKNCNITNDNTIS